MRADEEKRIVPCPADKESLRSNRPPRGFGPPVATVAVCALALSFLCGAEPADPGGRGWIAEFEQPCDGIPVCAFLLRILDRNGNALAEKVVQADGCGPQRYDIADMIPSIVDPTRPPALRVWSVGCNGVESTSYDWILLDPDPDCGGMTRTSRNGDVNGDGRVDISDPIHTLQYLYRAGPRSCVNAADANDDGRVDMSDAVFLLQCIFRGCANLR